MTLPRSIQAFLLLILALMISGAAWYGWQSSQTATIYRVKADREVRRYALLQAEDVEELTIARNAAYQIGALLSREAIVGQYATGHLLGGQVLLISDVTPVRPCDRPFATGRCLPENQYLYQMPVTPELSASLGQDDTFYVWGLDATPQQAGGPSITAIVQKKVPLELSGGFLFFAVTLDELSRLEGWETMGADGVPPAEGEATQGLRSLLVTVGEPKNSQLPMLARYSLAPRTSDDLRSFLPPDLDEYLNPYLVATPQATPAASPTPPIATTPTVTP